jgi:hypothetical protein
LLSGLSDAQRREALKSLGQPVTEHATPESSNEQLMQPPGFNQIEAAFSNAVARR